MTFHQIGLLQGVASTIPGTVFQYILERHGSLGMAYSLFFAKNVIIRTGIQCQSTRLVYVDP